MPRPETGVEQIDLYQMRAWDAVTPPQETLRFLDDAVRSGVIAYYGFSNHLGWQLTKAVHLARADELKRLDEASAPVVSGYPYGEAGADHRHRAIDVSD